MKNSSVITKERIIIVVSGILILMAGVAYRFFPDFQFSFNIDKVKMITKYQDRADKLPILEDHHLFLATHIQKISNHLISARSTELAGVAVQNMVREMASQERITLRSIKVLKADAKSYQTVSVVPVNLAFKARIRQLRNMLYRIETSSKLLSVSELRIFKPNKNKEENLNVIMTIQGFLEKKS